jgi:hypothetical protein
MTTQQDGKNTNVSLPAIERKDLHGLLEKYVLLTSFTQGTLLCTSCSAVLNDANMGALLVRGGTLVPFCNSPECIEVAMQERGK